MKKLIKIKAIAAILASFCMVIWCMPAQAISVREEEKLAREFMKYITRQFELVTDPTIVNYVNRVGQKILSTMPSQPFNYQFYVIKEDVYNAFAIPAGHIFIYSGLLETMETEDELAGILAHEIAHVACRHISRNIERSKKINIATMAGMIAGLFLGAATGDATAMQALTFGSAAAGQAASLAFSRDDESQADQLGLQYIAKSGYSPKGLLKTLKKIRSKQWFGTDQIPTYMMTHPAIEERITWIDTWTLTHSNMIKKPEITSTKTFDRIKIRLQALHADPNNTLKEFDKALAANPDDENLIYGRGLVLAQIGKRHEAIELLKRVQAKNALDPFIVTDIGRIYFLDGRYEDAIRTLEGVVALGANNTEGLFYLGRSFMELGKFEKAETIFTTLIEKEQNYQAAYFFLGETTGRLNKMGDAHYYLGIAYYQKNEYRTARYHLEKARRILQDPAKIENVEKILKDMGPVFHSNQQQRN